ncbi:MAG: hypothetical protein FWG47_01805 [Propionibacteriaceae bacterium]|nr:hypothetical protein [Propionibacteriaceae bacterium]
MNDDLLTHLVLEEERCFTCYGNNGFLLRCATLYDMVAPANVRLSEPVYNALTAFTARTGVPKSTVMSTAISEWLRLQGHPRIHFVSPIPGARRAALVDGPQVWSVAEAWMQSSGTDRSVESVAEVTGLRLDQVEAALSYWADNRDEIDTLLGQIHAAQEEEYAAWQRRKALDLLK